MQRLWRVVGSLLCCLGAQAVWADPSWVHVVEDHAHTLVEISILLYGSEADWPELEKLNRLAGPRSVRQGQSLQIPRPPELSPEQGRAALLDYWRRKLKVERSSFPVITTEDRWSVGVGVGSLFYEQPGSPSIHQMAWSGQASAVRFMAEKQWLLEASISGTLIPISSSEDDRFVRQWGANLRAGKKLLSLGSSWELWASGGIFLTSAFSSRSDFGYRNLWGFQFYPSMSYRIDASNQLLFTAKWVPLFSFSERELALGAAWSRDMQSGSRAQLQLNASELAFRSVAGGWIRARSVILGVTLSP